MPWGPALSGHRMDSNSCGRQCRGCRAPAAVRVGWVSLVVAACACACGGGGEGCGGRAGTCSVCAR